MQPVEQLQDLGGGVQTRSDADLRSRAGVEVIA
jgi:hypothetical protein